MLNKCFSFLPISTPHLSYFLSRPLAGNHTIEPHISLFLFSLASLFSHTPTQNPLRTLESGHHLTRTFCVFEWERPVLAPAPSCTLRFCLVCWPALNYLQVLQLPPQHLHSPQTTAQWPFRNESLALLFVQNTSTPTHAHTLPHTCGGPPLRTEEWWQLWPWPTSSAGQSSARESASPRQPCRSPPIGCPASALPARQSRTPPPVLRKPQKKVFQTGLQTNRKYILCSQDSVHMGSSIGIVYLLGHAAADGHLTVPQPRCHPGERGSPAVPVRSSSGSYPPSHSPLSATGRGGRWGWKVIRGMKSGGSKIFLSNEHIYHHRFMFMRINYL